MSRPSFVRIGSWTIRLLVLFALFFNVQPPAAARAASIVIRVTTTGATSGTCGDTWATACGLQYALVGVAVSGNEIWVARGTYKPTGDTDRNVNFPLRNGIALYGGFAMTETLRSQRDWASNVTTLSGDIGTPGDNADNSYHVVTGGVVTSTAVLDGFTVTGGNAADYGGGMINLGGGPTVTNVTFSGNLATDGGGMYNFNSNPTLTNVTFSYNVANDGGGMYNDSSSPTLTNVTFSHNFANDGGGMYNYTNSGPTVTNVTFSDNSAGSGGGMYNFVNSSPALTNVTFSGNSAINGGGMYNLGSSPTLTSVTFSNNSASGPGGGMYNNLESSSPIIRNTILWGNTAPTGAQVFNNTGTAAIRDSVVQGGCPTGSTCTNVITTDPRLGALGNYTCPGGQCQGGGSTQSFPLLPGSPAIDATSANCPPNDQRGVLRSSPACDIGAFESRGFTLTKISGDQQSTAVYAPFAVPLGVSVSSAYDEPVGNGRLVFSAPLSGASINPAAHTVSIVGGTASLGVIANSLAGSYPVTVTASGVITPVTFVLTNIPNTTTTLTSAPNPSLAGNGVTFTVTVTSPGSTPGGTVDLYEMISPAASLRAQPPASRPLASRPLTSQPLVGGIATFTASSLAVGTHILQAHYSGDANYVASTSATYIQVVNPLPAYTLTVSTVGTGSGITATTPSGNVFDYGTVVTVTATPDTGSTFGGWSSNCAVVGANCVVTMTANTLVTATFVLNLPGTFALSVSTAGNGSGTVVKSPDAISYTVGTVVTLTAVPSSTSTFAGWSGAVVTTTNPLMLTMDAAKAVTATFTTYRIYLPAVIRF